MTEQETPETGSETYGSSGIFEGVNPDGKTCNIGEKRYTVASWVVDWVKPLVKGTPVNYSYRVMKTGENFLTKIEPVQRKAATGAKSSSFKTGKEIKNDPIAHNPSQTPEAAKPLASTPPVETPAVKPVSSPQTTSPPAAHKDLNKVIIPPQTTPAPAKPCSCNGSCNPIPATLQVNHSPPPGIITGVTLDAKINLQNFETFGVSVTGSNVEIAEWMMKQILDEKSAAGTPASEAFRAYRVRVFGAPE